MPSPDPDNVLISRFCESGDADAFSELVQRYRGRVFRLAASILGPKFTAEAEEVAQEVFIRVHHALKAFRGDAQFSSWIYRITFNQAVNVKSRVRYRAPHMSDEVLTQIASPLATPHQKLQDSRRAEALAECMRDLPEVYQSALHLHYWMGEGLSEVAEMIGVPENTVKSYLHRARRLLSEMLKQRGYEDA